MSKKRILSNGHSSYWKDDLPKAEPKEVIRFGDNDVLMGYMGVKSFELFDRLIKKEITKHIKQKIYHEKAKANRI